MQSLSKVLSSLLLIFVLVSCQEKYNNGFSPLFDIQNARVISENDNLMSHVSSMEIDDDGTVYLAYYRDTEQTVERREKSSIEIVMDTFDAGRWQSSRISRYSIIKCGQTIGDYTQDVDWAPYDPALQLENGTLHCLFLGNKDGCICLRNFDTKSKRFEDTVSLCKISFGDVSTTFNVSSLKECYSFYNVDNDDISENKHYNIPIDKNFVKKDGWYYNVLSAYPSLQSRPIVFKTKDFITFETLFICPEFEYGCSESSIQIVDNDVFVMARSARPEDRTKRGVWIAKYSIEGKCLIKPIKLGSIESRMALINENGRLYSLNNVTPNVQVEDSISVHRSRVRICELNYKLEPQNEWIVANPYGISYFNVEKWKGKWFISYTEDINLRDPSRIEPKGNISFCEIGR